MAKVIRRGYAHKKRDIYRYACGNCDSEVEFDLKTDTRSDQRDGDYVQCPVCSGFIDVRVVRSKGKPAL